ncbi:DUF6412 domain-containing protein [Nocardia sp. NPDC019395]|uniref:DUF6412 domain-containing protein n=1 Tax=Nocardia sp. NPDC019395 TaxID=3154686 RepID=UPI0033F08A3C
MARNWWALARKLKLVQLTWVAVLTLVIATTAGTDGQATVVGAAVAVAVLVAIAGRDSVSQLHSLITAAAGPPREEKRLRGAFRRQSAPDTPGRPRLPRAPGRVPAAV